MPQGLSRRLSGQVAAQLRRQRVSDAVGARARRPWRAGGSTTGFPADGAVQLAATARQAAACSRRGPRSAGCMPMREAAAGSVSEQLACVTALRAAPLLTPAVPAVSLRRGLTPAFACRCSPPCGTAVRRRAAASATTCCRTGGPRSHPARSSPRPASCRCAIAASRTASRTRRGRTACSSFWRSCRASASRSPAPRRSPSCAARQTQVRMLRARVCGCARVCRAARMRG
jgi:hypothetical protein